MSIKFTAWGYSNMDDNIAIKVQGVSKTFKDQAGATTIKNSFIELGRKIAGKPEQHKKKGFTALKDINFEVKKGEFFGIVGRNGSGKSTLLKILAGVYTPTTGGVAINGSLTPFIELGVGFNPELTGKDNVYLNSALLGFSRKQTDAMYKKIVDFAELHDFMDTKLKNYSSGMQVRLAFSVAIRAESDILLIDEVLAVGDAAFQKKCFDYFYELKSKKVTVVFVSHDRDSLAKFCTRGILIDNEKIISKGSIDQVIEKYNNVVIGQIEKSVIVKEKKEISNPKNKAKLLDINILNKANKSIGVFNFDEIVTVKIRVVFLDRLKNPIIGATVWKKDIDDHAIYACNNITEGIGPVGFINKNDIVEYKFNIPDYLNDGEYKIEIGVANYSASYFYLNEKDATHFSIFGSKNPHAILADPAKMSLKIVKKEI